MAQPEYTMPEEIEAMRRELAQQKQLLVDGKAQKKRFTGLQSGKRTLKIAGSVLFVLVLAALVYALIMIQAARSRGEIPGLFGVHLFSVESGSMEPTLHVGSIIVSREADKPDALAEGDIVTFKTRAGAVVTHRIVEVLTENGGVRYKTKGDNPINSPDEELLTPDRVVAVFVFKIPLT